MSKTEVTQLLVAGGGPVGLFAALCAARRGLDVTVIERSFRGTPRGHTTLLHPSSLRLLEELGLSPLLLREGQLIEEIQLRVGSSGQRLRLPYPALAMTQSLFEEMLLKALRSAEVDVRATCEVTGLTRDGQDVGIEVVRREQVKASAHPELEEWETADSTLIRSSFVLAADGRHSHIRDLLGIGAAKGNAERFAMFEFSHARSFDPQLVVLGEQMHSLAPLANGRARCSFQLDLATRPEADLALLRRLRAECAPWFPEQPTELDWSGIVDFSPMVAGAAGNGRVWLVGDAAHTTSPLGVQSMNRGLTEAHALVEEMCIGARDGTCARLEVVGPALRETWLRELGSQANFELLPHAPSWLAGYAPRVAAALPLSGPDLWAVLQQLGVRHGAAPPAN